MSGSSKFHNVQIKYSSPGAEPPIFVAGSFTDPPWQPQELDYMPEISNVVGTNAPPGEVRYIFSKDVKIAEGRWQYKFRLGLGDWWAYDEHKETVTDESGNVNNVLTVKASSSLIRRPNSVPDSIVAGVGNDQPTQNQEVIVNEKISSQMLPHDPMRNVKSRILGNNDDLHSIGGLNARMKSQSNSWSQVSEGEVRVGKEISGNSDIELSLLRVQKDQQGQEVDAPVIKESSILVLGDDGRQHLSTPSGADQEGSRRRRRISGTISTSNFDISDDPKPSNGNYGYLWERFWAWLYSIWARLCGLRHQ